MRPQHLSLKNFMPFRSSDGHAHQVDFSALDLFAITGPMGSGKSALIDAMVWCLYGSTARYTTDTKGVISTGESVCEVAFDFTIGERWFRAVRRTGKTTESGLSEKVAGEEWVQDVSGAEQLTKRVEALLGLDFAGFTKTVILPQGSYAEFLRSEPNKRRDLLAKILELGVYSRVADRAKEVAGQAKTRFATIRETLSQYAGVSRDQVEQRRQEWEALGKQVEEASAQAGELRRLVQKAEVVAATLSRITGLQPEERTRLEEKQLARQKLDEAEARILALVQTLAQTVAEREALGYDASRYAVVKRAVAHLREHQSARQEAQHKNQALTLVRQEVNALTRQIADQEHSVAAARHAHQEHAAALQAQIAAGGDIALLTEKLGEAKRWKELRREQARLTEQQKTLTQQLTGAQQSLVLLAQQDAAQEQELHDLIQQRDRTREAENEKKRLEIEAGHLGKSCKKRRAKSNARARRWMRHGLLCRQLNRTHKSSRRPSPKPSSKPRLRPISWRRAGAGTRPNICVLRSTSASLVQSAARPCASCHHHRQKPQMISLLCSVQSMQPEQRLHTHVRFCRRRTPPPLPLAQGKTLPSGS